MRVLRPYCSGALHERLGFGVATLSLVELCQVVEPGGDIGVVGAKALLTDGEGALHEWFGFGVATLRPVERRQVVEPGADIGVVGAKCLLVNGKGALVERFGFGILTMDTQELSCSTQQAR